MSRITAKRRLRAVIFSMGVIIVCAILWMSRASLGIGIIAFLNSVAKLFGSLL